jgi:hypothetical protein
MPAALSSCVSGLAAVPYSSVLAEDGTTDAALLALMATGLGRWDALLVVAGADTLGGSVGGVPREALQVFVTLSRALDVLDLLATRNPEGANAALNAYLEGRMLPHRVDLGGRTWLRSLPGLTVTGYLDLEGSGITALRGGLKVLGDLYLKNAPIQSLPDGLTLEGTLQLSGSAIEALPEDMVIGEDLVLHGTAIRALPRGLSVGRNLILTACPHWDGMRPEQLKVHGKIFTDGCLQGFRREDWPHSTGKRET